MTDKEIRTELWKNFKESRATPPQPGFVAWSFYDDFGIVERFYETPKGLPVIEIRQTDGRLYRAAWNNFVWMPREEYIAKKLQPNGSSAPAKRRFMRMA